MERKMTQSSSVVPMAAEYNGRPCCPICLSDVEEEEESGEKTNPPAVERTPCCRQMYHTSCLKTWARGASTCPTCRHELWANDREENQRPRHPTDFDVGEGTRDDMIDLCCALPFALCPPLIIPGLVICIIASVRRARRMRRQQQDVSRRL